jgi:hypothetical protein
MASGYFAFMALCCCIKGVSAVALAIGAKLGNGTLICRIVKHKKDKKQKILTILTLNSLLSNSF